MSNRRTLTSEDRLLEQEIKRSTQVSSYLDNVYEAITTGNVDAARASVPNYSDRALHRGSGPMSHESGGIPMDMDGLFQSAADALGQEGIAAAAANAMPPRQDGKTTFKQGSTQVQGGQAVAQPRAGAHVSENQFRAIKKYPQIVEFLGTDHGVKIASKILGEITSLIANVIETNTKLVHENAVDCVAQKQYLHQFFKGDGWVCKVTASGPFRGSEAFYYKQDEDKSFILRKVGGTYKDVSEEFNLVHDYREAKGEENEG